jgi:aminoglycoside phosphotransferase (APT) family kinase protein
VKVRPDLDRPIAVGRTAEVFAWQPGTILKLYHAWCPPEWIENEILVSRAVRQGGVPAPAPGDIVEVDGRRGLVFERVDGLSMLADMNRHPLHLLRNARRLAELQAQIHRLTIPRLPPYRHELERTVGLSPHVPEAIRARALAALEALPDAAAVCHGDFHPGNVLLTPNGPIVIDWMTARAGSPWADVARTCLLLTIGGRNAGAMLSPALKLGLGLYYRRYLARYCALVGDSGGLLDGWLPVMAAARLDENIPGEREELIEIVSALPARQPRPGP